MERITINVADGTLEKLRARAAELGYIAIKGKKPGTGNVSALLGAVATGAVDITPSGNDIRLSGDRESRIAALATLLARTALGDKETI